LLEELGKGVESIFHYVRIHQISTVLYQMDIIQDFFFILRYMQNFFKNQGRERIRIVR
jgi:hypothetical protein